MQLVCDRTPFGLLHFDQAAGQGLLLPQPRLDLREQLRILDGNRRLGCQPLGQA